VIPAARSHAARYSTIHYPGRFYRQTSQMGVPGLFNSFLVRVLTQPTGDQAAPVTRRRRAVMALGPRLPGDAVIVSVMA
jgi:hypothetical protein